MTDNGAKALAERLVMATPRPFTFDPMKLAAAILANGAAFLPDAAELDRLRRIEAAARVVIAGGVGNLSPPKYAARVAAFDALDDALEVLQPEGSAGALDWNQRILAEFDRLVREHGEACDCSVCLAVQSLADVALDAEGSAGTVSTKEAITSHAPLRDALEWIRDTSLHGTTCRWCGYPPGEPHSDECPGRVADTALRAALQPEGSAGTVRPTRGPRSLLARQVAQGRRATEGSARDGG